MKKHPPNKEKIIVVLGPTATGKSDLAVQIAQRFNGEVVSADSRQVYTGLDIGTGKITKREMRGVPHHLLDVVNPKRVFTAAHYKKLAKRAVQDILARGRTPVICGGTGQYIDALVYDTPFPEVPPDKKLRAKLEKMPAQELFAILEKLDQRRAKNIDAKNQRRLIRAIEIATALGSVPHLAVEPPSAYDVLFIGLDTNDEQLRARIKARLLARVRRGMIAEANHLRTRGILWKRMEELGLEYRYLARYLRNKIAKNEMLPQLETAIWHYAKRQRRWFKRNKQIHWFSLAQSKNAIALAKKFVTEAPTLAPARNSRVGKNRR